ncbi:flagellar basal-body rod protein FlgG [Defluviitalea phaphyphila]|uniref:flagellar basal-body rod protein FlgG n=1 Tax=Defluviitalea phaphyphila TaxID=1473580 RepID=UPI00072FC60F|nr:flagellar basal-body rod protein FlgG [Defluviitalea phaphyphila]
MMRSLWTSASGMVSQQMNVDTIANNLANVNTIGYKKSRMEFKSLLYETMQRSGLDENGEGRPVNLQIGHGVRPIATVKTYTMGNIQVTNNPLDLAIDGDGFFAVQRSDDEIVYTRDGSFKISVVDGEAMIVTSDGYPVLSIDDEPIYIPEDVNISDLIINEDGTISYVDEDGETVELDGQIQIVQFPNRAGLENIGQNFVKPTSASGDPIYEVDGDVNNISKIIQGSLEYSNVQVVEEMVNLIIAQRAYEINSKAIQTSDDMLAQANQLKR